MNVYLFLSKLFLEEEKNIKDENSNGNHIADIIKAKDNDIGTAVIVFCEDFHPSGIPNDCCKTISK